MQTSLEHLPESKQSQLREITAIIVKAVDPEKVILFGSYATGRWVQERGTEDGRVYEYVSDYDILVITRSGDERKDYEVQDIIENRCVYKTPVNVIVHDIGFVNKMLSEGQYFFSDIEEEGILLYDAGTTALAERKPLSPAEAKTIAQHYFDQWFESAKEFLIDAQNAYGRNSLKNGAFYLHQAAERTYNAVILVEIPKRYRLKGNYFTSVCSEPIKQAPNLKSKIHGSLYCSNKIRQSKQGTYR